MKYEYHYIIDKLRHNRHWPNRYKWRVANYVWYKSGMSITLYSAKRAVRREAKKHSYVINPNRTVAKGVIEIDVK